MAGWVVFWRSILKDGDACQATTRRRAAIPLSKSTIGCVNYSQRGREKQSRPAIQKGGEMASCFKPIWLIEGHLGDRPCCSGEDGLHHQGYRAFKSNRLEVSPRAKQRRL